MKCFLCNQKVDETYRVNEKGDYFCSDDCYDEVENDDYKHPYIDAYEDVRFTYIDWLLNWESDLEKDPNPLQLAADMNEKIDEVYDAYWDFYVSEGDDGVFAHEIYMYLLKFEDLQKEILEWRPVSIDSLS